MGDVAPGGSQQPGFAHLGWDFQWGSVSRHFRTILSGQHSAADCGADAPRKNDQMLLGSRQFGEFSFQPFGSLLY
jgi:hypothetical protein